jgi:DNA-directed RNA polymerase specialized sigma24 family protein
MSLQTNVAQWERAVAGDWHARATLVQRAHQGLRLFVAGRCPRADLIEDIVIRCLVQGVSAAAGPASGRSWPAFLQAQARHEWHRALRTWYLTAVAADDAVAVCLSDACLDAEASAWEPPPTKGLDHLLHRLGPFARRMLRRRYIDAAPLVELAREHAISTAGLAARLHRIRRALRAGLLEAATPASRLLPRATALHLEYWQEGSLDGTEDNALGQELRITGDTAALAINDLCLCRVLACHLRPPAPAGVLTAVEQALVAQTCPNRRRWCFGRRRNRT